MWSCRPTSISRNACGSNFWPPPPPAIPSAWDRTLSRAWRWAALVGSLNAFWTRPPSKLRQPPSNCFWAWMRRETETSILLFNCKVIYISGVFWPSSMKCNRNLRIYENRNTPQPKKQHTKRKYPHVGKGLCLISVVWYMALMHNEITPNGLLNPNQSTVSVSKLIFMPVKMNRMHITIFQIFLLLSILTIQYNFNLIS